MCGCVYVCTLCDVDDYCRRCVTLSSDVFLPLPEGLLVNVGESRELISDLLTNLPAMFDGVTETSSALGAALQAAFKLMVRTV